MNKFIERFIDRIAKHCGVLFGKYFYMGPPIHDQIEGSQPAQLPTFEILSPYILVRAESYEELEIKVNGEIERGYQPQGGVCAVIGSNAYKNFFYFYQAMISAPVLMSPQLVSSEASE